MLSNIERKQLLVDWNQTTSAYPRGKCIHQLFEDQASSTPGATAVMFEQEQLTYQELNRRANQLAHYLRRKGVGPEAVVGICVERSINMVVGLLGILKAGGAYLPLDPDHPIERLKEVLEDARVKVLLVSENFLENFTDYPNIAKRLDTGGAAFAAESTDNIEWDGDENSPAYILYTSGSTGKSKGVL